MTGVQTCALPICLKWKIPDSYNIKQFNKMQHNLSNGQKCDEVDRRTARLTDKNANGKVHRHAIDASTDRKTIKNR